MFNNIKKILLGVLIKISLTLHKLDNQFFKSTKNDIQPGNDSEVDNIQSNLLKSLKKGEYNKEYVEKFYKILRKSDELINSNDDLTEISKKYGMYEGNQDLNLHFKNAEKLKYKKEYDTDIEVSFRNTIEVLNPLEILEGKSPYIVTKIKSFDLDRTYKIEEYTDLLNVRKNNTGKKLEFHINKGNIDKSNIDSIINEISKTKNIYFRDKYGELFSYDLTSLIDKIDDGYRLILTFQANEL